MTWEKEMLWYLDLPKIIYMFKTVLLSELYVDLKWKFLFSKKHLIDTIVNDSSFIQWKQVV